MSKVREIYESLLSDATFEPSLIGKARDNVAWKVAVQKLRQETNNEKALTYGVEDEHQKHPIDNKPNLEVAFDDITVKEFSGWVEKVGWRHDHQKTMPMHPTAVKYHQEYFAALGKDNKKQYGTETLSFSLPKDELEVQKFLAQKMPNAALEDFKRIYSPDLGEGYSSRIILGIEEMGLRCDVKYYKNGVQLGEASRKFSLEGEKLVVYHQIFFLRRKMQNMGFGSLINKHAEEFYKKFDVSIIVLHANDEVGGYAWARQGFDFISDLGRESTYKRFVSLLKKELVGVDIKKVDQYTKELTNLKHSWDFAAWNPDGRPWGQHLGKKMMLKSRWGGRKTLFSGSMSYKIGQAYFKASKKYMANKGEK